MTPGLTAVQAVEVLIHLVARYRVCRIEPTRWLLSGGGPERAAELGVEVGGVDRAAAACAAVKDRAVVQGGAAAWAVEVSHRGLHGRCALSLVDYIQDRLVYLRANCRPRFQGG